MTPREILLIPMKENDAGAVTVGGYLQTLLEKVWAEGESFNGKRPFGNSGWEYDLYQPLIAAGVADGKLDADGYVADKGNAEEIVFGAIAALFGEADAIREANAIAAAALRWESDRLDAGEDEIPD